MFDRSFIVEAEHNTERLDRFLEHVLPEVSRLRLRRAILAGQVTIDGVAWESGRRLRQGQVVRFSSDEDVVGAMGPEDIPLNVLFEDEALLIVNKPAGMLAHPTSRVHSGTLLNAAIFHVNRTNTSGKRIRPLLVHRLDRATSGAIVLSKQAKAHETLARAWNQRRVRKWYLALVCGRMPDECGVIDAPIGGARDRMPGYAVDPAGRPAQTRYRTLSHRGPFSFVELEPLTGRTNQLRIHCAFAGASIAGEDLHGLPGLERFSAEHPTVAQPGRLFLHASRLEFEHPVRREPFEIDAPLPARLTEFLSTLPS